MLPGKKEVKMIPPVPHPALGADPNDALEAATSEHPHRERSGIVQFTPGSPRAAIVRSSNHDFVAGLELITLTPIFFRAGFLNAKNCQEITE
jgi:hypothetical protein